MFGGGRQVAADGAELSGAGEGAQASGYFLFQLGYADVALGPVVVCWYPPVGREPQVVVLAVEQPAGQGVMLSHQRAAAGCGLVGAENACYLGVCAEEATGQCPRVAVGGRFARGRPCDDLRLVGLKLIFLVITRAASVLGLSRREAWWKDAEILMLRHQLAVALRERPRAHSRLTWPDRAWLALLAGTLPVGRLAELRLIVTPATILRWHRGICPPPMGAVVPPGTFRSAAGAPHCAVGGAAAGAGE